MGYIKEWLVSEILDKNSLVSNINFERSRKAIVSLGYDGPIKVWVNEKEIFYGPGTNPAIRDQKLYTPIKKGKIRLSLYLIQTMEKRGGYSAK